MNSANDAIRFSAGCTTSFPAESILLQSKQTTGSDDFEACSEYEPTVPSACAEAPRAVSDGVGNSSLELGGKEPGLPLPIGVVGRACDCCNCALRSSTKLLGKELDIELRVIITRGCFEEDCECVVDGGRSWGSS